MGGRGKAKCRNVESAQKRGRKRIYEAYINRFHLISRMRHVL